VAHVGLSREVIVLPAFMGLVFLFGIAHLAQAGPAPSALAADAPIIVGAAGALSRSRSTSAPR
jgi:hypothetical protein